MMKRSIGVIMVFCIALAMLMGFARTASAQPPYYAPISGNVNVFIGGKSLSESDWGYLDQQSEFGVQVDIKEHEWPISMALNFLGSSDVERDRNVDTYGSTSETQLGIKKIWEIGRATNLALGGGAAVIWGEMERRYDYPLRYKETDSETAVGPWASLGIYWNLAWINVGLEGKWSQADMRLLGRDVDAGGAHIGFIVGYNWGAGPYFAPPPAAPMPPPGPRPY